MPSLMLSGPYFKLSHKATCWEEDKFLEVLCFFKGFHSPLKYKVKYWHAGDLQVTKWSLMVNNNKRKIRICFLPNLWLHTAVGSISWLVSRRQWLNFLQTESQVCLCCLVCGYLFPVFQSTHFSLDVFHWACLNSYAASLPTNTAPAGYSCPNCKVRHV